MGDSFERRPHPGRHAVSAAYSWLNSAPNLCVKAGTQPDCDSFRDGPVSLIAAQRDLGHNDVRAKGFAHSLLEKLVDKSVRVSGPVQPPAWLQRPPIPYSATAAVLKIQREKDSTNPTSRRWPAPPQYRPHRSRPISLMPNPATPRPTFRQLPLAFPDDGAAPR